MNVGLRSSYFFLPAWVRIGFDNQLGIRYIQDQLYMVNYMLHMNR